MINDVKNVIEVYKYPKVDLTDGIMSGDKIIDIIDTHQNTFVNKFQDNDRFYTSKNQKFFDYTDVDAPANSINVPYARTMTNTVKGYMFKPGLIKYSLPEDNEIFDEIQDIFKANNEIVKTSELGEYQSKYGVAFELLFNGINDMGVTIPKFAVINPSEIIPIFDFSIEKNLVSAIYYYKKDDEIDNDDNIIEVYAVEVYYTNQIYKYEYKANNESKSIKELSIESNIYGDIPVVMYINNDEFLADYEPVRTMLVLYDKLFSDSANELDRFAAAYLVLKNYILAGDDESSARTLRRLKKMRVFEIEENGDIRFLTKDIPVAFFQEVKNTLREDITYHSQIPDFRDDTFGTASGIAIKYKLLPFENLAASKEAYFLVGLERRLALIKSFMSIKTGGDSDIDIDIQFLRNLPDDITEKVNIINTIKASGLKVAEKTLLKLLSFIENPDEEIEQFDKESDEAMEKQKERFDIESMDIDEEEKDKEEEVKKDENE